MFLSAILAGFLLVSCNKELGYTGFVDPDAGKNAEISLATDKAAYAPGETVTFTASQMPAGAIYIRYRHLGENLGEQAATGTSWTWTAPNEDFTGYLVEVYQKSSEGETILATIGVDVSSDWTRFPRYGFLSSFGEMPQSGIESVIDNLNRHHINGVQFQDWHYKHHWPLGGTRENPLASYLDIASRTTYLSTLQAYIEKIHSCGMKAIFYNLCFGALDDAAQDGVNERWYIFQDNNHAQKDVHALSAPFKSSIYLLDPGNSEWQEYIGERNDDVYAVLDFDGYQIDQLGSRGTRYNYDGQTVDLPGGYASFIRAMKSLHPQKRLVMNAVSGYGAEQIVRTGQVDFCYNEMWGSEDQFSDLRSTIEANDTYSDGTLKTVFAAYMNYDLANNMGTFNTPGVLLTNAVIFALGGSHLELGEHMLCKEYFPNSNLGMSSELQEAMVAYYDFLVAYENLLRDGGELNDVTVRSTDGKLSFAAWAPTLGNVVTLGRKVGERQVIHLLNFSQANSLSWRDLNGTMPEPQTVESATVEIVTQEPVDRVWMASPDINGGAVRELAFEQTASGISVTLPSIKYWDMLVLEQD